jgi:integrase
VEVSAFLSHLAEVRRVSASTQNQALCTLLFLYRHVLPQELGQLAPIVRARRSEHLSVVLARDEVRTVLHRLDGVMWLAVSVLYGAGLRLSECLGLRVKDLDFATGQIVVRSGKGGKDRVAPLPAGLTTPLSRHLERVRRVHTRDLARGFGRVVLPEAIVRKYPTAAVAWGWQFVFPAARLCRDPRWGAPSRYHLHEDCRPQQLNPERTRSGKGSIHRLGRRTPSST